MSTRPFNIRLPDWAVDFIDRRARESGLTKTEVVLEALRRLQRDDLAVVMRQGYAELRELDIRLAEEGLGKRLEGEVSDGG